MFVSLYIYFPLLFYKKNKRVNFFLFDFSFSISFLNLLICPKYSDVAYFVICTHHLVPSRFICVFQVVPSLLYPSLVDESIFLETFFSLIFFLKFLHLPRYSILILYQIVYFITFYLLLQFLCNAICFILNSNKTTFLISYYVLLIVPSNFWAYLILISATRLCLKEKSTPSFSSFLYFCCVNYYVLLSLLFLFTNVFIFQYFLQIVPYLNLQFLYQPD